MMNRILKIFKTNQSGIISGFLTGTSYIPFPPWAIFFCYLPLWIASVGPAASAENQNSKDLLKTIFWRAWWTQFILTLIGFHWVAYVAKEFGYMPWPIAIILLIVFAATVHLYIPVAMVIGKWISIKAKLNQISTLVLWACLIALGEMFWPSLFPWNLGYTFLWIKSPIFQTADIWGFQGLSFAILLSQALLAWTWIKFRAVKTQAAPKHFQILVPVLGLILFWGALHFWGIERRKPWQQYESQASASQTQSSTKPRSLNVMVVQANIGNLEKVYAERGQGFQQEIIDQYFSLTREGLKANPQTDLIVYPESAYPDVLNDFGLNRPYSRQLFQFLQEIKKPILTGGYGQDPPEKRPRGEYNSLFLMGENGLNLDRPYNKTYLLAYGEYVPFGNLFPILKKWNPGGPGFNRGNGPQTFQFENLKIGVQICYESLYPEFSRTLAELNSDFIVNVTNDSWFGPTSEPYQHLFMTLGRAIEIRKPLIRSTNTGITTAIQADGSISEMSPLFRTWTGNFQIQIPTGTELTFYTRFGAWLWLVIVAVMGVAIFCGKCRNQSPPQMD